MPRPTILIVEDNKVNMLVLRLILRGAGYVPLEAKDGEEAISVARAARPEVVLMDIMMPRRDGISAAREILRNDEGYEPQIIAVTGNTSEALVSECRQVGFREVFTKPINAEALLAAIDDLFPEKNP